MPDNERLIRYIFKFDRGKERAFDIRLDNNTLDLIRDPQGAPPEWTQLSYHKCPNCPLDESKHERCPIAVNLAKHIGFFNQPPPSPEVDMTIETPERTYSKRVDFKTAQRSFLGLYMVTSNCPVMDQLRSMAWFHLPFATKLETTYRTITNHLIAQYLKAQSNGTPDWELKELKSIYENIDTVNRHFRERLKEAGKDSFSENTFFTLDLVVNDVKKTLDEDSVGQVEDLFQTGTEQERGETLTYKYEFQYGKNEVKDFTINIDSKTLRYENHQTEFPAWTRLQRNKCPNCPLDEKEHPNCPAATAISETIEFFSKTLSIDKGKVTIRSEARDYSKEVTITDGVSAMMGLIMASSGCPIVGRLKPLVRHHLPFATREETAYRSLGMYLLSQSFINKKGGKPDWKLEQFANLYQEINVVNKAFCERLQSTGIEDASLNALVKLDCFAHFINFTLSDVQISGLKKVFQKYTEG